MSDTPRIPYTTPLISLLCLCALGIAPTIVYLTTSLFSLQGTVEEYAKNTFQHTLAAPISDTKINPINHSFIVSIIAYKNGLEIYRETKPQKPFFSKTYRQGDQQTYITLNSSLDHIAQTASTLFMVSLLLTFYVGHNGIWRRQRQSNLHLNDLHGKMQDAKNDLDRLSKIAFGDPDTALPNRQALLDRLQQVLKDDNKNFPYHSVGIIAIEGLQVLRNHRGQVSRHQLLKWLGARLLKMLPDYSVLAKLDGDQFGFLYPVNEHEKNMAEKVALDLASRLAQTTSEIFEFEDCPLNLNAYAGISLINTLNPESPEALLNLSDSALLNARSQGQNACLFTPDIPHQQSLSQRLEKDLPQALHSGQMTLDYQPKIDARSNEIYSIEALARWRHPEHGDVSPSMFIPIIERLNLARPFTRWVLNTSMQQTLEWHESGHIISLAINLSSENLLDEQLALLVRDALEVWDFPSRALTLEFSEQALMIDQIRATQTLRALTKLDVRLSLTSLGTGYSTFAHLHQLPFDEIKIDRSHIASIKEKHTSRKIIETIVNLGQTLGISVVAEGVEDLKTSEQLLQMLCHKMQGYFFSEPLSAKVLNKWLASRTKQSTAHKPSGPISH